MKTQKSYNGNLTELRKKKERMLKKKHFLNLEIKKYSKMTQEERDSIFKNIGKLSSEIDSVDREIIKIQTAMQNSGNWMDGDFNNSASI